MARLKTHYKRFAYGGAVDLKVTEQPDDASTAFQGQIDALRRAEAHVAQAATQPQHNLTPRQQAFLDANPEMLDQPERLSRALLDAHKAGHEPDSDAFHKHVEDVYRIQHLEVAAANAARHEGHQPGSAEHRAASDHHLDRLIDSVNDEPPKFFKPKPLPERRPIGIENMATSLAKSDPVIGDTASQRYFRDSSQSTNPTKITLSPQEKEIARTLGQSEVDYARGKVELLRRKADGVYGR